VARGDDWPQFRGPRSNSAAPADAVQIGSDLDPDRSIAWKVDLPGRGPSSPIVVAGRVFVTASSGNTQDRLHVLCFDAADGRLHWHRQFWATGRTITHSQSANAAPTPASDGKRVVAFFSSNDLVALDLEGNLLWYRGLGFDFPRQGNDAGMASSPVIVGDTVVVQSECQAGAFVSAFDLADGTTRWSADRPRIASWTSPIVIPGSTPGTHAVLAQSTTRLTSLDAHDGRELWNYTASCDGIASACFDDGLIFLPSDGITALRPAASGAEPEVVWKSNQLQPGAASPIAAAGKLYLVNRGGVLTVAECATGRILSRTRLSGSFWSTPVLCGNRIFACAYDDGTLQLVEPTTEGAAGQVIAKLTLGEHVQASPAMAGGAIYIRSDQHLFKIAGPAR
jgi:outer membrane protein assembly factor BamB